MALRVAGAQLNPIVGDISGNEDKVTEAMAWAKRLAEGPTFALGMTKELLNGELSLDLHNALDNEARAQAICMQTRDFREAYDAFTQKRPPKFTGR